MYCACYLCMYCLSTHGHWNGYGRCGSTHINVLLSAWVYVPTSLLNITICTQAHIPQAQRVETLICTMQPSFTRLHTWLHHAKDHSCHAFTILNTCTYYTHSFKHHSSSNKRLNNYFMIGLFLVSSFFYLIPRWALHRRHTISPLR